MIEQVFDTLSEFERAGFAPFYDDFVRLDWLRGRRVQIAEASATVSGVADGVDLDGSLIVASNGQRRRIVSGSVRLDNGAASA